MPTSTAINHEPFCTHSCDRSDGPHESFCTHSCNVDNKCGMRLYVAGPMTGLPEHNFPAFFAAEAALTALGYDVLNPARHGAGEEGMTWADYMRRAIPDVLAVDALALLDGWESSRGARLEVHIAETLGMLVKPLAEWVQVPPTLLTDVLVRRTGAGEEWEPVVEAITLPAGYASDGYGFNKPTGLYEVPVVTDPNLPVRGETRTNPYGPPKTIVLREWDERVLLHEVLHVLLDGHIPHDGNHGHPIINRLEVGLMAAGYARKPANAEGADHG